jgi:exodeoxyribonuclease VII large subunit
MSVADLVANMALKTPTAAADFIIDTVTEVENHLYEIWSVIRDHSRIIIEKNRSRVELAGIKLVPVSRIMISDIKDQLSEKIIEIINVGKEYTFKAGIITTNHLSRLVSGVKSYSNLKESAIAGTRTSLKTLTLSLLEKNRALLDAMNTTLNILKPENVLLRGYTITSFNGKILRKGNELEINDLIDTQFSDGAVKSRVVENKGDL